MKLRTQKMIRIAVRRKIIQLIAVFGEVQEVEHLQGDNSILHISILLEYPRLQVHLDQPGAMYNHHTNLV